MTNEEVEHGLGDQETTQAHVLEEASQVAAKDAGTAPQAQEVISSALELLGGAWEGTMAPSTVLVTGASRFIGGQLAARLAADPTIDRVRAVNAFPPRPELARRRGRAEFVD